MRRRRLLNRIRRLGWGALLLPPLFACGGLNDPGERQPIEVPDDDPPPKIPPPIHHGPMSTLAVERLGPEVDAPQNVLDIAVDGGGGLWIASDQGAFVRPPGEVFFRGLSVTDGMPAAQIRSVGGLGPGAALIGFHGAPAHVVRLRASSSTVDARDLPKLGEVSRSTSWDRAEGRILLVASTEGLGVVAEDGTLRGVRALPAPSGDVGDVAVTPAGDVWVGDPHKLTRLSGPVDQSIGGVFSPVVDLVDQERDDVVAVDVCPDGTVWASTLGSGVVQLSATGDFLRRLDRTNHLPQDHVPSLACDVDGSVWIGTSWGGLVRVMPDGSFRYHGVAAGLPGDSIRRLLVTLDGNGERTLWIGTEGGAAAYRGP